MKAGTKASSISASAGFQELSRFSPASCRVLSTVPVTHLHPREGGHKTIGFQLEPGAALALARDLMMLALNEDLAGYVQVTIHLNRNQLTVLRYQARKEDNGEPQPQ